MGGGGVKAAAYHIGVCMALQQKGFYFSGGHKTLSFSQQNKKLPIEVYVGSSAGSFIASILASGKPIEALIKAFNLGLSEAVLTSFGAEPESSESDLKTIRYRNLFNLNNDRIFKFIPNFLKEDNWIGGGVESFLKKGFKLNGLFTTEGLEKYLNNHVLDVTSFDELASELYIVASQLNHPQKVIFGPKVKSNLKLNNSIYLENAPISRAVSASSAVPPVFAPVEITVENESFILYDGEIRDTLSTHIAADVGADLIISAFSIQPYKHSKNFGSLHKLGIPAIINQAIYQILEQKVSKHIESDKQKVSLFNKISMLLDAEGASIELKNSVLQLIRQELNFNENIETIYISPRPQDHEMFFADHFSLNSKILEKTVKIGFKSALNVLRQYEFET